MTDEAVVKFDPRQFAEQLKDKIRLDIATFLPEEEWKKLIEAEVKGFLEETWVEKQCGYGKASVPSGLRVAVWNVLSKETETYVRSALAGYLQIDYGKHVSTKVDTLIAENLDGIVRGVMGPLMQRLFSTGM